MLDKAIKGTRLRPDAVDYVNKIIRELKPDNVNAINKGIKQLEKYVKALEKAGFGKYDDWKMFLDLY